MMHFLIKLKRKATASFIFSTLLCGSINSVYAVDNIIIGNAYSLKTGSLLYRETHKEISDALHKVEYLEPDGKVFGRKTIDFSQSLIAPSLTQLNERNGEEIYVRQENSDFVVRYKESSSSKPTSKRVKININIIIDAGFDGFIKRSWSVLESGKKLDVDYLVPSKQTTFRFRFSRAACVTGTKTDAVCFSLSPVSWVVKLAVDPIIVAYDESEKKLIRFTGRGNVANTKGKYENVDIQYRYL